MSFEKSCHEMAVKLDSKLSTVNIGKKEPYDW